MTERLAWPFAIVGLVVTIAGAIGAVALRIVDPVPVVPSTFGFADLSLVSFGVLGTTFAAVGALLVVRLPHNSVGWCMVVVGASYAGAALAAAITFSTVADGPSARSTAALAAWFAVLCAMIGALIFVLGLIFPTGRGATPAWDRFLVMTAIAAPIAIVVGFIIRPGPLQIFPTIDNPFGVGPDLRPIFGPQPSQAMAALSSLLAPVVVWSMVVRWRRSDEAGRQQLKWFVVSLVAAVVALALTAFVAALTDRPPEAGLALFGFISALVPVAIGMAILRYRLYDLDRIISRTLAYATITGVLAFVFTAVILAVSGLLTAFAQGVVPSNQGRSVAVAVSTLVVFALFQPVRRSVQRAIDRRFDRARYDADKTVVAFTGRLRDDVDLAAVSQEIVSTATIAVRPTTATVWLRGKPR